jgi:biphenyl-2,3-diol 1,2-dioxygenase
MNKLITELGYLGLEVSDLPRWQQFTTEVLGMGYRPGPSNGKASALVRMDHHDRRILLLEGVADDFAFAGWQSPTAATLAEFAEHLERLGVSYAWGSDAELELRGVDRMLHFTDPSGLRHEAFYGPMLSSERFVSPRVHSSFVTGAGGMGHAVFPAPQYAKSLEFTQRVFGMAISDYVRLKLSADMSAEIAFLHINPRHHSIAFAQIPGAKRMHHFMVEVADVTDVGRARDRCLNMGLPVAMDIGQHPNDGMVSFYGETPSGFLVEFGWGGVLVDEANWQQATYSQISEWGHRPAAVPPARRAALVETHTAISRADSSADSSAGGSADSSADGSAKSSASFSPATAGHSGRWNVVITTPMGERKVTFDLRVSGDRVQGSMIAPDETNEILQGSVAGNLLRWRSKVSQPLPMDVEINAEVRGQSISGEVKGPLGAAPFSGVRAG